MKDTGRRLLAATCLATCFCWVDSCPSFGNTLVTPIVLSGEHAPGLGPDAAFYSFFRAPHYLAVDGKGQVTFAGNVNASELDSLSTLGYFRQSPGEPLVSIVQEGTAAQLSNAEIRYGFVDFLRSSDSGDVAFISTLATGTNEFLDTHLLRKNQDGKLQLLATEGGEAPAAGPGVEFERVDRINIHQFDRHNNLLFASTLQGTTVDERNNQAIFRADPNGQLSLVVREGGPAPGLVEDATLEFVDSPRISRTGRLSFESVIRGPSGISVGVFNEFNDQDLALVARTYMPAPDTEPDVIFRDIFDYSTNAAGQAALEVLLTGPSITPGNGGGGSSISGGLFGHSAIYRQNVDGQLVLVAREGFPVDDAQPENVFGGFFRNTTINNNGYVAFQGGIEGDSLYSAIFAESEAGLEMIAREGDPIPGFGPDVLFGDVSLQGFSDSGHTLFRADLRSPTNDVIGSGLFRHHADERLKLLTPLEDVPQLPEGIEMGLFTTLGFSEAGHVWIYSFLRGTGVDLNSDEALFAIDVDGELHLIAREGDALNVSRDPSQPEWHTISSLRISSLLGSGELKDHFDDQGRFVFRLNFDSGLQGFFLANLNAVPEATSITLSGFALFHLLVFSRSRALRASHCQ